MTHPAFWVFVVVMLMMPVRFAMAWMVVGFWGAVRGIANFWLGYLLFAGGGFLILYGVIRLLSSMTQHRAAALLVPVLVVSGFIGWLWLIGFAQEQWDRLRDKLWPPLPPTQEQIEEAARPPEPNRDPWDVIDELAGRKH